MKCRLYLMYDGDEGFWGVFHEANRPEYAQLEKYFYRFYKVKGVDWQRAWSNLCGVRDSLNSERVVPNSENQDEIYPKIADLLRD